MSQIYKLFYNNRVLVITDKRENVDFQGNEKSYIYTNASDLIITVRLFEKNFGLQRLIVIAHGKVGEVLNVVKSMYQYVSAAGGIVKNTNNELLFISRFHKWDLPKGHVEEGESIDKAAYREVVEETSVKQLTLGNFLGSTFHIYFLANTWCVKETHYFLMETKSNDPLIPQSSEAIDDARWIDRDSIDDVLEKSYSSINDFIHEKMDLIFG